MNALNALIVYCHPDPASFTAAVRDAAVDELQAAGAGIRILDLYADGFNPVLSRKELEDYLAPPANRQHVMSHAENVLWCNMLIFVYPTWWYGTPGLLKGWLDRVMVPGLAFHMPEQSKRGIRPGLTHINRLGAFTTCGASWAWTQFVGAPGKKTLLRGLRGACSLRTRTAFAALYRMDSAGDDSRARHLSKVRGQVKRLIR